MLIILTCQPEPCRNPERNPGEKTEHYPLVRGWNPGSQLLKTIAPKTTENTRMILYLETEVVYMAYNYNDCATVC